MGSGHNDPASPADRDDTALCQCLKRSLQRRHPHTVLGGQLVYRGENVAGCEIADVNCLLNGVGDLPPRRPLIRCIDRQHGDLLCSMNGLPAQATSRQRRSRA